MLVRHHVIPRLRMFFPHDAWECPIAIDQLQDERTTHGAFVSGSDFSRTEPWRANVAAHLSQPEPWKGTTCFQIKPRAALTDEHTTAHVTEKAAQGFEAEIYLTLDDFQKCLGQTYDYQESYLASAAKRQKVEVKMKELNSEDQKLFSQAKNKELDSWLATDTVKRKKKLESAARQKLGW